MMWSDASMISSRCCSASNGSRPSVSVCAQSRSCVAVGVGHAEHVGDHPERQREREVGDHVHRAVAARHDGVERVVDQLLHAGRQLLDRPGREHLLHQPAEAGVVGRVEVEDAAGAPLRPARRGPARGARPAGSRPSTLRVLHAELRVAQEPDAVVVAGTAPTGRTGSAAPGCVATSSAVLRGTGPRRSRARTD